jgi:cyclopropane-fatty-acyl-phospholipid synthase
MASIEMSEHVGQEQCGTYASTLHRLVRPGGRVLAQAMSHPSAPGGGAFIERYVAPDMHMRPTWGTVAMLSAPGLELRDVESIREHYDWTVHAWAERLEERWDDVVGLIGPAGARIWRLHLAGGGLTFREGPQVRAGVPRLPARDDGGPAQGHRTAMTDKRMHSSRRGFAGYVERTSGCVPRPPRRSAPHRDRRQSPH